MHYNKFLDFSPGFDVFRKTTYSTSFPGGITSILINKQSSWQQDTHSKLWVSFCKKRIF